MIMWPQILLELHSPHVNLCVIVYEFVCVPLCLLSEVEGEKKVYAIVLMFELGKDLQGGGWPTTGRRKVAIVVTCGHQGNPRRRPALYLLHQEVALVYMLTWLRFGAIVP